MLDGLLLTAAVLMTLAVPTLIILTESYTHPGWSALTSSMCVVTAVAYFARSAPYKVRVLGLLFGLASVS